MLYTYWFCELVGIGRWITEMYVYWITEVGVMDVLWVFESFLSNIYILRFLKVFFIGIKSPLVCIWIWMGDYLGLLGIFCTRV